VRREVWARDQARCAFVGRQGRCPETKHLEFHHIEPYADDGPPTAVNIELRCRAHNVYEAEMHFGPEVVAAGRSRRQIARTRAAAAKPDVLPVAGNAQRAALVPGQVASAQPARARVGQTKGRRRRQRKTKAACA
jgi:hypothetical protein